MHTSTYNGSPKLIVYKLESSAVHINIQHDKGKVNELNSLNVYDNDSILIFNG